MKRFIFNESGQGLAEYGLITGLITIGLVATLSILGSNLSDVISDFICKIDNSCAP